MRNIGIFVLFVTIAVVRGETTGKSGHQDAKNIHEVSKEAGSEVASSNTVTVKSSLSQYKQSQIGHGLETRISEHPQLLLAQHNQEQNSLNNFVKDPQLYSQNLNHVINDQNLNQFKNQEQFRSQNLGISQPQMLPQQPQDQAQQHFDQNEAQLSYIQNQARQSYDQNQQDQLSHDQIQQYHAQNKAQQFYNQNQDQQNHDQIQQYAQHQDLKSLNQAQQQQNHDQIKNQQYHAQNQAQQLYSQNQAHQRQNHDQIKNQQYHAQNQAQQSFDQIQAQHFYNLNQAQQQQNHDQIKNQQYHGQNEAQQAFDQIQDRHFHDRNQGQQNYHQNQAQFPQYHTKNQVEQHDQKQIGQHFIGDKQNNGVFNQKDHTASLMSSVQPMAPAAVSIIQSMSNERTSGISAQHQIYSNPQRNIYQTTSILGTQNTQDDRSREIPGQTSLFHGIRSTTEAKTIGFPVSYSSVSAFEKGTQPIVLPGSQPRSASVLVTGLKNLPSLPALVYSAGSIPVKGQVLAYNRPWHQGGAYVNQHWQTPNARYVYSHIL